MVFFLALAVRLDFFKDFIYTYYYVVHRITDIGSKALNPVNDPADESTRTHARSGS